MKTFSLNVVLFWSSLLLASLSLVLIISISIFDIQSFVIDAYAWYTLWGAKLFSWIFFLSHMRRNRNHFILGISAFIIIALIGMILLAFQYYSGHYLIYLALLVGLISLFKLPIRNGHQLFFSLFLLNELFVFYLKIFDNLTTPLYLNGISLLLLVVMLLNMRKKSVFSRGE